MNYSFYFMEFIIINLGLYFDRLLKFWPGNILYFPSFLISFIAIGLIIFFKLVLKSSRYIESRKPETKTYKVTSADKFKNALLRTRSSILCKLDPFLRGTLKDYNEFYSTLEESLITADIGVEMTVKLIDSLKNNTDIISLHDKIKHIKELILNEFVENEIKIKEHNKPYVIMVVGVNGVGKTTTIGKISNLLKTNGKKVIIAAADTFRAAAIEQLSIWANRLDLKIIKHKDGADPSAVVYDALEHCISKGDIDYLIIDTAGRLHTKKNLMEELKKIKRTITKLLPNGPDEILLVLDATIGQNALEQAKIFHESLGIDFIALTKLDGTAKGGIIIRIFNDLKIPIKFVGLGENIDDLKTFDPQLFVDSLL